MAVRRQVAMDCKEFERLIPDFVSGKLDFRELKRFTEHFGQCSECQEELTIQFLVTEGMQRLEEGSAFDLQKELHQRLEESKKRVRLHDAFLRTGLALEIAAAGALAACIVWILI